MSQNGNVYTNTQPLLIQLYGKADIKYAVAARANEKPLGCATVLFKDAVKAVFIAAIRANLELVFELDWFYFSIHYITCFTQRDKYRQDLQDRHDKK
jgi:hypothetical protein